MVLLPNKHALVRLPNTPDGAALIELKSLLMANGLLFSVTVACSPPICNYSSAVQN